jgi:hypothetical protein
MDSQHLFPCGVLLSNLLSAHGYAEFDPKVSSVQLLDNSTSRIALDAPQDPTNTNLLYNKERLFLQGTVFTHT